MHAGGHSSEQESMVIEMPLLILPSHDSISFFRSRWFLFDSCLCCRTGSMRISPEDMGLTVIDRLQGDSANYVNIPVSPTSKRQLHYIELDLQNRQESSHTVRGALRSSYLYTTISSDPERNSRQKNSLINLMPSQSP